VEKNKMNFKTTVYSKIISPLQKIFNVLHLNPRLSTLGTHQQLEGVITYVEVDGEVA
jgi:hypothetical protein